MELITAIALLCQLNIGTGENGRIYNSVSEKWNDILNVTKEYQGSCQKELATCILKKDKLSNEFKTSSMLKCIKERK